MRTTKSRIWGFPWFGFGRLAMQLGGPDSEATYTFYCLFLTKWWAVGVHLPSRLVNKNERNTA